MTLRLQFRMFRSKLSFRTLYDFALNKAIDVHGSSLSHKCSIVVVKVLNTLILQSFSS